MAGFGWVPRHAANSQIAKHVIVLIARFIPGLSPVTRWIASVKDGEVEAKHQEIVLSDTV
jgi:hypothetical protein